MLTELTVVIDQYLDDVNIQFEQRFALTGKESTRSAVEVVLGLREVVRLQNVVQIV